MLAKKSTGAFGQTPGPRKLARGNRASDDRGKTLTLEAGGLLVLPLFRSQHDSYGTIKGVTSREGIKNCIKIPVNPFWIGGLGWHDVVELKESRCPFYDSIGWILHLGTLTVSCYAPREPSFLTPCFGMYGLRSSQHFANFNTTP